MAVLYTHPYFHLCVSGKTPGFQPRVSQQVNEGCGGVKGSLILASPAGNTGNSGKGIGMTSN